MRYYNRVHLLEWVPEDPITLEELKNILTTLQEKYGKNARLHLSARYNNISAEIEPTRDVGFRRYQKSDDRY